MNHNHDDELFNRLEREMTPEITDLNAERARRRHHEAGSGDTHFDVPLDDEEAEAALPSGRLPLASAEGAVVESAALAQRPILPSALQNWANIKSTIRRWAGLAGYHVGFQALRSPWYAAKATWWTTVGLARLSGQVLRWWWLTEQAHLRQGAATANDPAMWLKLHREVKATRTWRGAVLAGGAVLTACLGPAALSWTPVWALAALGVTAVYGLARLGRPAGASLVTPAVVTPRFRRINLDVVLRAYYAAGLGKPDKPDAEVRFGSTMARDASGSGSHVVIDLPYGRTFDDAVKAKGAIASGLDVSVNQVFLSRDHTSHRRHVLFVADRDPLAIPAGRTALLDGKVRDIWGPVAFGLDERGQQVDVALMWLSVLVGAQPRKGKTFSARLLALHAALDPYVKLIVADAKNSPDWRAFRLVAHRVIFGTHPGPQGDPVEQLLEALRELKAHIMAANAFLSTLPTAECPDGKLTRELSRKYPQLRVHLLVMEEFQAYFELEDQDANKEIAALLAYIQAVGPSVGVILISSSQKPSGVGAGDVARLFNRYRDNHTARFALKCGNRTVSEAILGSEAYGEGIDASSLPNGPEYRGVGYLYGLTDNTPTVRSYLADAADAEKILTTARAYRERLGTLTGQAAGEDMAREFRDVLADVHGIFHPGEAGLPWAEIAARLAETNPEGYAEITSAAISAQLRDLGIPSVNIKHDGATLKGARLAQIEASIARRKAA